MKKVITTVMLFVAAFFISNAQTTDETMKVIQDYYKQLNSLRQSQSTDGIMALTTDDFIFIDRLGKVKSPPEYKKGIDGIIESLALNNNYSLFYKIDQTWKTIVDG